MFVSSGDLTETQLLDSVYCIQRLAKEDCQVLTSHNMVSRLLSQFADILSITDLKYTELQRAVLDLVSLLARVTVEPCQLTQYLRFFTLDNPPLECLLPPLVAMVANNKIQPTCALRFPVTSAERVYINSQASPAEKTAVTMHHQHVTAGIQSSWSCCALALPINTDLGWSMWVNGFSVSFWLRLFPPPSPSSPSDADLTCSDTSLSDICWNNNGTLLQSSESSQTHKSPPSKPETPQSSLLHLISVGFDVMVLEVWLEPASGKLVFRLVRPDGKRQELLCESSVSDQLTTSQWHHLAINVRDSVQKRKVVIEVLLLVDGFVAVQVPLVFTGLLIRKARPSCLLLGHCGQTDSSYMITSVLMFRAPVFNRESAISLVAHGPDYIHLTQADVGNVRPNLSTVFSVKSIQAGVNWEFVYHEQISTLRVLQENLLLSFSAENYTTMNAYPQAISHSTGVVGSLFPPTPGFRVATVDTRASQLLPLSVRPIFFAPLTDQHYHSITAAAETIGGISVFLFLFARVIELKGSEECQAQALYVLLKLAQSSCELNSQFESRDVPRLLSHALASPQCSPSMYMLKMFMDVCCDRPGLLTVNVTTGAAVVNTTMPCVVTEPTLLAGTVIRAWRQWARTPGCLWTLFQALQALLRDDHPFREFNAAQFNRARLVDSLLLFCKERFLSGEQAPSLEPQICDGVVELIRSLMGAPPELPHIISIYDYLILAHPAHATYVTSVRPSFYFLVTSHTSHPSSNHSEVESTESLMKKSKSMTINNRQKTERPAKRFMTQPVDPTKLNKALANLQIKQLSQQQEVLLSGSLDTNRSDIFTSSGQGSMDEFSSDDKLFSSLSDPALLKSSSPLPPPLTLSAVDDDEKEKAEVKEEDVKRLVPPKPDNIKREREAGKESPASALMEGLLLLLRDIMLVLPDSMVHQVLSHVIRVEALLVMANHQSASVRMAVVKVLTSYIQRAADEDVANFSHIRGYYQLANQLGQWPATTDLLEGVLSMVTGLHWLPLDEQLREGDKTSQSLQLAALPPLLALLPASVHDVTLAHLLIHFLQRLFTKVAQGQRTLMECGLLETLCKTIVVISETPSHTIDLFNVSDHDILIADIQSFLVTIVSVAVHSPGNHNMQVLTDILVLLRYLERQEGNHSNAHVQNLRSTQCTVLSNAVRIIQDKITCQQPATSTIRSTARALFNSVRMMTALDIEELVDMQDSIITGSKSSSNSDSVNSLGNNSTTNNSVNNLGWLNRVPRSEINDRFKMIVTKATEFFIYSESIKCLSEKEIKFAQHLFSLLLSGMTAIVERRSGNRDIWSTIFWNCRDTVRSV
ncbi:hypothetical protein J6590_091786 [Homalodisca vitripennis]|nr:hypothetical protein J6590_091786 [Homalodisca vitripennis]